MPRQISHAGAPSASILDKEVGLVQAVTAIITSGQAHMRDVRG